MSYSSDPLQDLDLTTKRKNRGGIQDQFRTLIRRGRVLVDGMDPETFNRRPAPDVWSVAEYLDHLNETARVYLPEFADTIEAARAAGRVAEPGSPERTLLGRLIAWTQEPPGRLRMKAFASLEPAGDQSPHEVVEAFEALHEELIVRINEAADLDRKAVKLRSPQDPRLKLCLGDWFHFMAAHARWHIAEAEAVRAQLAGDPPHTDPLQGPGDRPPATDQR